MPIQKTLQNLSSFFKVKSLFHLLIILLFWVSPYSAPLVPLILCMVYTYHGLLKKRVSTRRSVLLLPYLLLMTGSLAGSIRFHNHLSILFSFFILGPYLLFGIYFETMLSSQDIVPLLKWLVWLSIPSSAVALFQKIVLPMDQGRVLGTFSNSNYYAFTLEAVVLLTLGLYPYLKTFREKWGMGIITTLNLLNLYLSGCRAGIVVIGLAILFYFILLGQFQYIRWGTAGLTGLFLLFLIFPENFPRIQYVYEDITSRFKLWRLAFTAIQKSPFIGQGFLHFRWYALQHSYIASHSHNLLLNLWVEFGLPGVISGISIAFITIRRCIWGMMHSTYRSILASVLSILLAAGLHGMVDIPILGVQTSLLFAILLAIPIAAVPDCKKKMPRSFPLGIPYIHPRTETVLRIKSPK